MHISLITPAAERSLSGNRATAVRWAGLLRELGHRVSLAHSADADAGTGAADLTVAIHAWRSAAAVRTFRARYPRGKLAVLLSGTDVYRFQHTHPEETLASMAAADRLIGLHERVGADIPAPLRGKLRIILQSALPLPRPRQPGGRHFDVCVVGHLREEKDPLRAALAVRDVPAASRLRVLHLGKAHAPQWAGEARAEMAANPRYLWRGEVPRWAVRRRLARAALMVISSRMEGGANVVSEAVCADLPVVASAIPGNVGLLGVEHPGYFPVADTDALRAVLLRAESEPAFLEAIRESGAGRRALFTPARERDAWRALLAELG